MLAKHLQSRCPVWALATLPLLFSLPAQVAIDHNAWHTHVLRPHAVLRWPVMLCNLAFANAMFSFAWWPKSFQRGGLDVVYSCMHAMQVQIGGGGQWLPAEEQLPCQMALHSCQLARLLALMTRPPWPPCQHPAHRRTAQQWPPISSASAAIPGKECALSMPPRCTVLFTSMLKEECCALMA